MTTPAPPLINVESKRDHSPKGTLEQRKVRIKEPYCTLVLDSQHTVQSALTMESTPQKPQNRLVRKSRKSEKSGVSGKHGGDDDPKPLPRKLESGKKRECNDSDFGSLSVSVKGQGRGRTRVLCSNPLEKDKEASCGDTHATVVSSDVSGQDLNRKKEKRRKKKRSSSTRLKKLTSAGGPSTMSEGGRRRSSSETPSNRENELSHELPPVEGTCRIRRPTLSPNTSRRGLQRAASVPDIVDVIVPNESRLPNGITGERSKSLVPSRHQSFDRYSQVSRLSPILSVASTASALSSPVSCMVDAMREHLEIFSLNHAPSQTEEAIARMRIELDAIDAKQRRLSTSSAQTRSTFVEMSIGDRVNPLNDHREMQPQPLADAWIPSAGRVVKSDSSKACSSTSVGSGSANRIQSYDNSAAAKTAGRQKKGQSIVRRLLRSMSPRPPPNSLGDTTLSPNQRCCGGGDDSALRDTCPSLIHRVQLCGRRRSMSFANDESRRERGQARRNSVDQTSCTTTVSARDAVKEMELIQQQLERDMDRLHQKWDDLQRKRSLIRTKVSVNQIS